LKLVVKIVVLLLKFIIETHYSVSDTSSGCILKARILTTRLYLKNRDW